MTIHLNVFKTTVEALIDADDEILAEPARERYVRAALRQYSTDKPDSYTEDVTGDAGRYYAMSNLTNWSEGFSQITRIEYPAATIASDEAPVYLDPEDWSEFEAEVSGTLTRHVYFPNHAPAATETFRVTYSLPYTFSASTIDTTIPEVDFYAVCYWAAGLCCQSLAAKFAKSKDSTFAVDSATHTPKSDSFAARAQEFFNLYNRHLGIAADEAGTGVGINDPAGEFVDWDTVIEWPAGRTFIFRGGR
jgi:hypothetical protein